MGFVELLFEHAEIHGVADQGDSMATRRQRKTGSVRLFAEGRQDCSWTHIWEDMYTGKIKGMMAFGMNGVMIGPDTNKNINALKKADWLVVGEIYQDETSEFWKAAGDHGRGTEKRSIRRCTGCLALDLPKKMGA